MQFNAYTLKKKEFSPFALVFNTPLGKDTDEETYNLDFDVTSYKEYFNKFINSTKKPSSMLDLAHDLINVEWMYLFSTIHTQNVETYMQAKLEEKNVTLDDFRENIIKLRKELIYAISIGVL